MLPVVEVGGARVFLGDCRDVLKSLPDNSVDSVVTDPPYELGFMGKKWDSSGVAYDVTVWAECLRVLKPGGHILAFGGSRTWHRLAVAVEDAGFELRDSIAWIYGSGFPKSLDVSKAIDKRAGAERGSLGLNPNSRPNSAGNKSGSMAGGAYTYPDITAPSTSEAKKWQGWGTALKPAFEPVVVGRKPLVGTVAENVLAWGVGGLNIDGSRIGSGARETSGMKSLGVMHDDEWKPKDLPSKTVQGRWPANVILDEVTAGLLDEQSGVSKSPPIGSTCVSGTGNMGMKHKTATRSNGHGDSGGASRFFFVADTQKHDKMSLCKNTNANNVATLFSTIRATIESSAQTIAEGKQNEPLAQLVSDAGIRCDSCATHIAADLVALKSLVSNEATSPHFHRSIKDFGSSILTQNLVSLVEQWVSTDTIPTMTDFSTLFGCVLLATDEPTKRESLENDKGRSRFIYQAKASKRDRNEGLEELEATSAGDMVEREEGSAGMNSPRAGAERTSGAKNFHPTVKPTQLMRYLIKLVTPEGGIVLDPFTGSGSTGKAALLDGFKFIGAELTEEYLPIIEGRLKWASEQEGETDERLF